MKTIQYKSTITCPICGFQTEETMPQDSCQFFYECKSCKTLLKPKQGDCCVYCSYGSAKCPSIQKNESCCWFFSKMEVLTEFWQKVFSLYLTFSLTNTVLSWKIASVSSGNAIVERKNRLVSKGNIAACTENTISIP